MAMHHGEVQLEDRKPHESPPGELEHQHVDVHMASHASTRTQSADNPAQSRLMGLTAELRNMIFEPLLLEAATPKKSEYRGSPVSEAIKRSYERLPVVKQVTVNSKGTGFTHEPALLAVCRQLRQDYLALYHNLALTIATSILANVHNFDVRISIALTLNACWSTGQVARWDLSC